LIDLPTKVRRLRHHADITSSVHFDLNMWSALLGSWNGVPVIQLPLVSSFNLKPYTDASCRGVGAYFNGAWISSSWPVDVTSHHIARAFCYCFLGSPFTESAYYLYTDNEAIVHV